MAIKTTSQTGPISASSTFGGSAFNAGDQIVVAAGHTLTIDQNSTIGDSRPVAPVTVPTLASVVGGGSLATATYRLLYTNVAGGKESARSPESATQAITNGNTLRVTLPALPTGVDTRNIYITTGATLTEKLYKTGTTGTTVDLVDAQWTDNTTTEAAAAAFGNGYAVTNSVTGPIVISTGVTALIRGDASISGNITLNGTAKWKWDASAAPSPTNTPYAGFQGTSNTGQTGIAIATSGTSAGARATFESDSGGANGYFRPGIGSGLTGNFLDTSNWNLSFADFVRVGNATFDAITITPSAVANVQTFDDCTWDSACGALAWSAGAATNGGWSITDCDFNQTASRQISGSGVAIPFSARAQNAAPNGTRLTQNCSFVKPPYLCQHSDFVENYCHASYEVRPDLNKMRSFDSNLIRLQGSGPQLPADAEGNYFIFDPTLTLKDSGTATGATNGATTGTLSDSGKAWGTTQYGYAQSSTCHQVKITGGTGSGQVRRIVSHNNTQLTVQPPWTTTPSTDSTYQILLDIYNPHYINACTVASQTNLLTDNVFENGGTDPFGDIWKTFSVAGTFTGTGNVAVTNGTDNDCSGTMLTMFNNTNAGVVVNMNHNTGIIGTQALFHVNEGGTNQTAGTFGSCKSNLGASILPKASYPNSADEGYLISDSDNPAGGTTDIIAPANVLNNWLYQGNTGGVGGAGFNLNLSSTPSFSGTTDPQFVDATRKLKRWGQATQSTDGTIAAALLVLQNDPTKISDAVTWVRAGFAPQNAALQGTAHDAGDIGAVAVVITGGPAPHHIRRAMTGGMVTGGGVC